MSYYSPELKAQAEEIIEKCWDYHPDAKLPDGLILAAYEDGIWVCDTMGECDMFKFKKLGQITSETWA
jgi:hypothetical protein